MKKNILITGGAQRIGKEISIFFAKKGWNIVIHFHKSPLNYQFYLLLVVKHHLVQLLYSFRIYIFVSYYGLLIPSIFLASFGVAISLLCVLASSTTFNTSSSFPFAKTPLLI